MLQRTYRFACVNNACFNNGLPFLVHFFCKVWFYYICTYTCTFLYFFQTIRLSTSVGSTAKQQLPLKNAGNIDVYLKVKVDWLSFEIWVLCHYCCIETSTQPWDPSSTVWFDKGLQIYIKKMKNSQEIISHYWKKHMGVLLLSFSYICFNNILLWFLTSRILTSVCQICKSSESCAAQEILIT